MRILLNPRDTEAALDRLEDQVATLRAKHRELRALHKVDRDGYPPSSGFDRMPASSQFDEELDEDGNPVLDEHGVPVKVPLPPRSDPVASLVVSTDEVTDPIGSMIAEMVQHIMRADKELESGIGCAARARPPVKVPDPEKLWCENCIKYGVFEPREENRKVCRWCRDENTEHGHYPSRGLVEAHARGTRITASLRSSILAREAGEQERQQQRRGKKSRRGAQRGEAA